MTLIRYLKYRWRWSSISFLWWTAKALSRVALAASEKGSHILMHGDEG